MEGGIAQDLGDIKNQAMEAGASAFVDQAMKRMAEDQTADNSPEDEE